MEGGFVVLHRTDQPNPIGPAQQPFDGPSSSPVDFEITGALVNPKARCYLTGMEIGSCTCKKHKVK